MPKENYQSYSEAPMEEPESSTVGALEFGEVKESLLDTALDIVKEKNEEEKIVLYDEVKDKGMEEMEWRTIVKLSSIPRGFVEDDIKEYFEQFGEVIRAVLVKSAKTGKSMDFAFIQFEDATVAKIAAETMNNYVVFKTIMKAAVVSDMDAEPYWKTKNYVPDNCPGYARRMKNASLVNRERSLLEEEELKKRHLRKLRKKITHIHKMGIGYCYWPQDTKNEKQCKLLQKERKKLREEKKLMRIQKEQRERRKQGGIEEVKTKRKLRLMDDRMNRKEEREELDRCHKAYMEEIKKLTLEGMSYGKKKFLTPEKLKNAMAMQIAERRGVSIPIATEYLKVGNITDIDAEAFKRKEKEEKEKKRLKEEKRMIRRKKSKITGTLRRIEDKIKECAENRKKISDTSDFVPCKNNKLIMDIDESDTEIEFKTPPNVVKRKFISKTKMHQN